MCQKSKVKSVSQKAQTFQLNIEKREIREKYSGGRPREVVQCRHKRLLARRTYSSERSLDVLRCGCFASPPEAERSVARRMQDVCKVVSLNNSEFREFVTFFLL